MSWDKCCQLSQIASMQATCFCAAVDGKNNARLLGGDTFDVEITGPGNSAPKADVTDNNNGWEHSPC